jgi:hypothetical protein
MKIHYAHRMASHPSCVMLIYSRKCDILWNRCFHIPCITWRIIIHRETQYTGCPRKDATSTSINFINIIDLTSSFFNQIRNILFQPNYTGKPCYNENHLSWLFQWHNAPRITSSIKRGTAYNEVKSIVQTTSLQWDLTVLQALSLGLAFGSKAMSFHKFATYSSPVILTTQHSWPYCTINYIVFLIKWKSVMQFLCIANCMGGYGAKMLHV